MNFNWNEKLAHAVAHKVGISTRNPSYEDAIQELALLYVKLFKWFDSTKTKMSLEKAFISLGIKHLRRWRTQTDKLIRRKNREAPMTLMFEVKDDIIEREDETSERIKEAREKIQKLLCRLKGVKRHIVQRLMEGKTRKEIAQELGTTTSNVGWHLKKIRELFAN